MEHRTTQRIGLGVGIALIAIYSVIMISTGGSAPLAWILLFAGIGTLIAAGTVGRQQRDE